jgi:hypothetical protein
MRIPIIAAAVLLSSCGQAREAPQQYASRAPVAAEAGSGWTITQAVRREQAAQNVVTARPSTLDATSRFTLPESGTMLIREARVVLRVDSVDVAVRGISVLARRYGGIVATSAVFSVSAGATATLSIRVPAARLDSTIAGLSALGLVEAANITSQDVTEEFVDVTARLENTRRLEARLLQVLANRTGKLTDVLEVEQALARVREEAERMEGRRRYLETRAAVSTLEIQLHPPAPQIDRRLAGPFSAAASQAWSNAVTLLTFAISSLGVVLPLCLLVFPGWLLWRRRRREPVVEALPRPV